MQPTNGRKPILDGQSRENVRYPQMTLSWESTYAIAMELRRRHRDADIEGVTLKQIHDWTLELSEFEDDPALANDDILYAIYQDWYEEHIHGRNEK